MRPALFPEAKTALRRAADSFLACIEEEKMTPMLDGGAIVALSGGPDSVLLLHLMQRYATQNGTPLAALHINHGIRGEEADRDEDFCRTLCASLKVPLFVLREDVPAYRARTGLGMEEAARRVRYTCFDRILAENPAYVCVLTAHNATDNLETFFLRMLRGSGLHGLCGIPAVRGHFLRPLLRLARRDIMAALSELGAGYVTDSTNTDTQISRNYIRAELLPRLAPLSADPEEALTRLIGNLRAEEAAADAEARAFFAANRQANTLPRAALADLPRARICRVLSLLYEASGGEIMLEQVHYNAICKALPGRHCATFSLPGGIKAGLTDRKIFFTRSKTKESAPASYEVKLSLGCNRLGDGKGELWLFRARDPEFEERSSIIYNLFIQAKIDSATIMNGLVARDRRAGDAYRYGKMTRDVRRLMAGAHLPHELRAVLPVVCDGKGILWVPGFGVRDGAEATSDEALFLYYGYREDKEDTAMM